MRRACGLILLILCAITGATLAAAPSLFVREQPDGRSPMAWRVLDAEQAARFDLGHAVFNTSWVAAGQPAGRRDGLGPLFNAASCDACHNSRRRGRGPQGDGPAPIDLVVKAGRRIASGQAQPTHPRFGHVINTAALDGYTPEADVFIRYRMQSHVRPDGSQVTLHAPTYRVVPRDGLPLPSDLVLMPRMPPSVHGAGLLEQITEAAIIRPHTPRPAASAGKPAWIDTPAGPRLGRFGWQASEPSLAQQLAAAFAREMGLGNALVETADCGQDDAACHAAATGGTPEVQAELFAALLDFQQWESLRRTPAAARHLRDSPAGGRLFEAIGCGQCHRSAMPIRDGRRIAPYTDLRLHDLGPGLADRDSQGMPVHSSWRTAPLWGLSTALEGGRPVRLLHDGRARSVEEAIAWHEGTAAGARQRFDELDAGQRQMLIDWVSSL